MGPQFKATTHRVAARVFQLDESEPGWDYYALHLDTSRSSVRENGGGGQWMELSAWTPKATADTEYTKAHQGRGSTCAADLAIGLTGAVGPLSAGISKAIPVFCSAAAKVSLATDYRGGRWHLDRPELADSAELHKVIRVRRGSTPSFTVLLRAPCQYADNHGGISMGHCDQRFVLDYRRKDIRN